MIGTQLQSGPGQTVAMQERGKAYMRRAGVLGFVLLMLGLWIPMAVNAEEPDYILGRAMTDEEIAAVEEAVLPYAGQGGYLEEDEPELYEIQTEPNDAGESSPFLSHYDLRQQGVYLQVKQQRYGDCWAFATMDMLQIGAQLRGIPGAEDLSERHLVYYTYHSVFGNRGQQMGEGTRFMDSGNAEKCFVYGGKYDYAIRTLGAYVGAAKENEYPYEQAREALPDSVSAAYEGAALRLKGAYIINANDRGAVKEKILEYGSVGITYCSSLEYYNYHTAAQYCPLPARADHAVVIIGWDDSYSRDNFKEKPSSDGAWLVKNSWGTVFGIEGYFWLSYEDASIGGRAYALEVTGTDTYKHIYQCDNTLLDDQITGEGTLLVANSYVLGEGGEFWEKPEAVSVMVPTGNMQYSLNIYQESGESLSGNPEQGMPLLAAPVSGRFASPGLYTIELDEEIQLPPGSRIYIVLQLLGERPAIYTDATRTSMYTVCNSVGGEGVSYYKAGDTWIDFGSAENKNFRIKLFTSDGKSVNAIGDIYQQYLEIDNAHEAVAFLYDQLLYRAGEADGIAFWVERSQSSEPIEILEGFLFSDEYRRKNPEQNPWLLLTQAVQTEYSIDVRVISALYDEILGRPYDLPGFLSWAEAMERGMELSEVRKGFLESTEYRNLH